MSPEGAVSGIAVESRLTLEVVRMTEQAAIAAARWRGKGDERQADRAAMVAMHDQLNRIAIDGRIVIGEESGAELLALGTRVGTGGGPAIDIAIDPLEGVTGCAKSQPDSLSVLAIAERGGLMEVPHCYMEKIAIGAGYPEGIVDLDRTATENVMAVAAAKGVPVSEIVTCVLDRPRHAALIAELREAGVAVKLLADGDIAAAIHAANSDDTGIDIYMGSGGAPEGVLAAAAMHCIGGQMQGRLILDTAEKREKARALGVGLPGRIYSVQDMARGDVMFSATGVTNGTLLDGVRVKPRSIRTSSVVMRSWSQTIRWITAEHRR